jgi:hypothetical protein
MPYITQWWQLLYFWRRRSATPFAWKTNEPAGQKTCSWFARKLVAWCTSCRCRSSQGRSGTKAMENKWTKGVSWKSSGRRTFPSQRRLGNTRFRPFPRCRINALSASARETGRATYSGRRGNTSFARSVPAMRRRRCGAAVVAVIIIVVAHVVVRGGGGGQDDAVAAHVSHSRAPLSVRWQSTAACKPDDAPVLPGEALRGACEVRLSTRECVCTCGSV